MDTMNQPGTRAARTMALAPGEGERFTIIGGSVRILIDGEASGGQCCVFECPIAPGDGPPLHIHEREDELFYVVRGRFKSSIDGRQFIGEPGFFGCAPRGSVHAFRNIGAEEGLLHLTCAPAGLETAFQAVRLPDPGSDQAPLTPDEVVAVFARHGVMFVGPPLEN